MIRKFRYSVAMALVIAGMSAAQAQDAADPAPAQPPEMNTRDSAIADAADAAAEAAADAADAAADAVNETTEPLDSETEPVARTSTAACSPASSPWITGDVLTSDLWAATDPIRVDLPVSGESGSSLAFRVGQQMMVRVEAAAHGDDDPQIWVIDSRGQTVAENDDAGDDLSSRVERYLDPGDYCVHVESFDAVDFDAIVQISQEYQPRLFNDDEGISLYCGASTAATQPADKPLDQAITERPLSWPSSTQEPSYFRFSVEQAAPIRLTARSDDLDPKMSLFGADGRLIASNDDADDTDARLDFSSNLLPGDYCLAVAPLEAGEGAITVSASMIDAKEMLREGYANGTLVPPFGGEYPVTLLKISPEPMVVPLGSDANWYNFNLDQPVVVVIETYGSVTGVDAHLSLKDSLGRIIAEDDNSGGGSDAKLGPLMLEPGRYNLALSDVARRGQVGAPTRPVGMYLQWFVPMQ